MERKSPRYIPASEIQQAALTHQWDDWDPYPLIGRNDEDTEQRLSRVSNYGKFAFSLGCAEWVLARLSPQLQDARAWQYLDACWAYAVSPDYSLPAELDDAEWRGSVLGPVCLALTTIVNTRYGFDEFNAEIDSALAEKLALHVVPNADLFKRWRDAILDRMVSLWPVDLQDPTGERLPRDVLDPQAEIDLERLPFYLERTLVDLELKGNPFANKIGRRR